MPGNSNNGNTRITSRRSTIFSTPVTYPNRYLRTIKTICVDSKQSKSKQYVRSIDQFYHAQDIPLSPHCVKESLQTKLERCRKSIFGSMRCYDDWSPSKYKEYP